MSAKAPLKLDSGKVKQFSSTDTIPSSNLSVACLFVQTADKTVTGTAEASIIGTGTGSVTIGADTLAAGDTFLVDIRGFYTRTTGTIIFKSKFAGTTQASDSFNPAGATNGAFAITVMLTVRTIGASGTMIAQGYFQTFDNASPQNSLQRSLTAQAATFAVNTTVSNTYDFTSQFSAVGSTNSLTSTNFTFEKKKI